MTKRTVKLTKDERIAFANTDLAVGAMTALSQIPGISNPEVIDISGDVVTLNFDWSGTETFWEANEILIRFGFALA